MKTLLFKLNDETFGISINYVEAIEHIIKITSVPKSRNHIAGIVNIRGHVVPVVDLSVLLNLKKSVLNDKLILIHYNNQSIALMVDDVDDVIDIENDKLKRIDTNQEHVTVIDYKDELITYVNEEHLNKI